MVCSVSLWSIATSIQLPDSEGPETRDDPGHRKLSSVEPHFEKLKELHHAARSTNGTVDFGEFVNAARMFSSTMANTLNIQIQHFIMISQARSGTTWLKNLLDSHPNVFCAGELFINDDGLTLEEAYRQLEEKAKDKQIMTVGFKLHAWQIKHIHGPVDLSGTKILFYWRRNVVRQYISALAHEHSHQFQALSPEEADNLSHYKPFIDIEKMVRTIDDTLTERCEVMRQLAGAHSCPTLHYEDLLGKSFDKEVAKVEACLGTPHASLSSNNIAIHVSRPLLSTVENPAEVQSN